MEATLPNWKSGFIKGNADAQYNLGCCYRDGHGVPQDHAAKLKWWRNAAEQGYAKAQCILGVWYETGGSGVPHDYGEAVKWYRKAAEQGDADAQSYLGCCYHDGHGVPQDYAEAVNRFVNC